MIQSTLLFLLFFGGACRLSAEIYSDETPTAKYLKKISLTEPISGIEMIDCIYVINLDERMQKWDRMVQLFDQRGLHGNRVGGINGWRLSEEIQAELAGPYPVHMRGGQLGCLLSHLSIIQDAFERNFDVIWVCEDDIEFLEDVRIIPELLINLYQIDPDWEVFYTDVDSKNSQGIRVPSLGSNFRPDQPHPPLSYYTQKEVLDNDLTRIRQRFGMYSVIISRNGIKKILDYFTHMYLWSPIDIDIHYIPNIREYSATRDIVSIWTQSAISDTEQEIQFSLQNLREKQDTLAVRCIR